MMVGTLAETRTALMTLLEENVAALREARADCLRECRAASGAAAEKTARPQLLAVVESLRKHTETALRLKERFDDQEEFERFTETALSFIRNVDPALAYRIWEALGEAKVTRPRTCPAPACDITEEEEPEEE